jgi:sugar phosphate isomerase/epimerase
MRPRLSAFPKCFLDQIAGDRSMSVFDWIAMARDLDADGLEMYEGFFESLDDAYIHKVGEAIRAAGFAMPMLCCSPDFTDPDPEARKRAVERQSKMVVIAHRLGGPGTVCRVLSGQRRPGVGRRQGIAWVVSCIEKVLPVAREHGVILGLENHYKDSFWTEPEFAQKADVFLELLADIPERRSFGVQYDPSNAIVAGDDPIALLEAVADRVVSMHASDRYLAEGTTLEELKQADGTIGYSPNLKHGVTGEGLNDYDAIFRILAAHGYHGWISIEDGMNGMDEMARSLAFLRAKVAEHFPA